MSRLLEPVALGPRTARNAVVFGPHETNLARGRSVSDRHVAYYRRRAAGGVGTIVIEEASVHPSDWPTERSPLAAESAEGWAAVAVAAQAEGALVLAGLGHAGGQGSSAYSQAPLWAPSRIPEVNSREVPKAMEEEDIEAVIAGFAAAAALAAGAGLDGVEVNAGQHSLLRQFASGLTNQRTDDWGQDRGLLLRRVLVAARAALGPDGILGVRLSCDELAPWAGLVPETGGALAAEVAPLVDALTVVRGSIFSVSATRPGTQVEAGFNRELTGLVHEAVAGTAAVVAQGSIVDPALAEELLGGGICELVEMTRALVADPDLVAKAAAGTPERIRPCIRCNQGCQVRDNRNPIIGCVGEPATGWEGGPDGEPAGDSPPPAGIGPLLVVGGGPAGLECARVAALGGLRVTLVEEAGRCGGAVRAAAAALGREALAGLVDWHEAECRRLGVEIILGTGAGPAEVGAHAGPVVLATGSRPGEAGYLIGPGATPATPAQALTGELPEGPVVVWDPIGGPIGVSVAETLRAAGREVTLVTQDLVVGQELARSGDLAPANGRLQSAGVVLRRRSLLRGVDRGSVRVEDRFTGEVTVLEAAVLVDAGHRLPETALWEATGSRLARAGDGLAPRGLAEAVREGRRTALALLGGSSS